MSPVVELIIDLVTSGLSGPGSKPRPSFPEGEGNASLGAVAAFVGVLAAIFSVGLLLITLYGSDLSVRDYIALIGASFAVALLALGGRWAGVRAPSVTKRNLGLSRFGRGIATIALGTSCLSILAGLFHVLRQVF